MSPRKEPEIMLESGKYESLTVTLSADELLKIVLKGMSYESFDYDSVDVQRLYDNHFQIVLRKPMVPLG